jgi:hypothetical protein
MPIMTRTISLLRFASVAVSLGLAVGSGFAQSPAATLGNPKAVTLGNPSKPIVRASGNEMEESSEPPATPKVELEFNKSEPPKASRMDYPPKYSSNRREIIPKGLTELWKKGDAPPPFTTPQPSPAQTYRDPRQTAVQKEKEVEPKVIPKETPKETLPQPKVSPEPAPKVVTRTVVAPSNVTVPAWRWYGYGTITPGIGSPNGGYPLAPTSWLQESRATPGAIPRGFLTVAKPSPTQSDAPPIYQAIDRNLPLDSIPLDSGESITVLVPAEERPLPLLNQPQPIPGFKQPAIFEKPERSEPLKNEEPEFILPPPLPPTGTPVIQKDAKCGTTIYFKVPGVPTPNPQPKASFNGSIKPNTLPPTSMRPGPTQKENPGRMLVRAQAPAPQDSPLKSPELAAKIERAAMGAKEVHLKLTHPDRVAIRLIVSRREDVELITSRIGALPELRRFYLDFDVKVQ